MNINSWMSWEGGVDLVALSAPDLGAPNVIVHLARMVNTPVGSAPSGLVLLPDFENPTNPPVVMGFVSGDATVGAYFGPHLFAGTPFEHAPVLQAEIQAEIQVEIGDDFAAASVRVGEWFIETRLESLEAAHLVSREAGALPFSEQAIERAAKRATLKVNGHEIETLLPPAGMSGGPAAALALCGFYAR